MSEEDVVDASPFAQEAKIAQLSRYVLSIPSSGPGRLSEVVRSTGLQLAFHESGCSTMRIGTQGTDSLDVYYSLEREADAGWAHAARTITRDPLIHTVRLSSAATAKPEVPSGAELIHDYARRDQRAWGRFWYFRDIGPGLHEWVLTWSARRDPHHVSAKDLPELREALAAMAGAMPRPKFSFRSYFEKHHAERQVPGSPGIFDFCAGELVVDDYGLKLTMLQPAALPGLFDALGIARVEIVRVHDARARPVPVIAKGFRVTVTSGDPAQGGDPSSFKVRSMTIEGPGITREEDP